LARKNFAPSSSFGRHRGRRATTRPAAAAGATTFALLGLWGVTPVAAFAQTGTPPSVPAAPAATPAIPPSAAPAGEVKPADEKKPGEAAPAAPPAPVKPADAKPAQAVPAPPPAPSGANTDAAAAATPVKPPADALSSDSFAPFGPGTEGALQKALPAWLKKMMHLNVTGSNTFSLRQNKVSGGKAGTQSFQYESGSNLDARRLGPFQHNVDVTVNGDLFGVLKVDGRLSNSRWGNYVNQNIGINYDRKGTQFQLGNVNASLGGGGLVNFSKNLQGIVIGRDFGGGKVRTTNVFSLTKAHTVRNSFQGNGSAGPYSLGGSLIVEGSERIRVNGRDLRAGNFITTYNNTGFGGASAGGAFGPSGLPDANGSTLGTPGNPGDGDYSLDYYTGLITFREIIPQGATVEYSYESRNYSGAAGFLAGTRWDLSLGNAGTIGATWLEQRAKGGNGRKDIAWRSPVFADPNYVYYLPTPIETGTKVRIFWREQELVENIDFKLDFSQHFFRLLIPRPPDDAITNIISLRAEYKPLLTQTVGGDKRVRGINGQMRLGGTGNLAYEFGQSEGRDGTGTGQASKMTASFSGGKNGGHRWNFSTTLTNIAPGFSGIDSVDSAFLRAEKGLLANFNYSPGQYVTFGSTFNRSRVAQQGFFGVLGGQTNPDGTPAPLTWANNENLNLNLALSFPHLPQMTFGHSQVRQAGSTTSTFTSDRVDMSWQGGSLLKLNGSLARNTQKGRSVFGNYLYANGAQSSQPGGVLGGLTGAIPSYAASDSTSDTARIGITLTPAAWLSLNTNVGTARTRYGSSLTGTTTGAASVTGVTTSAGTDTASNTRATDFSTGVTLTLGNLQVQGLISDAQNGQSTAAYYGGPRSSSDTLFGTTSGQRTRTSQVSLTYAPPIRGLLLNFDTNRSLALVPGYDNTKSTSSQFGFQYSGLSKIQLSGSLGDQGVTYVGNEGDSRNRSYDLTATVGPFGRVSLTTSLQKMNTGSFVNYGGGGGVGSGFGAGGSLSGGNGIGGIGGTTGGGVLGGTGSSYGGLSNYLSQDQNLTVFTTRASLDVGGNRSLYLQWQSLDTRTPRLDTDLPAVGGYRLSTNSLRSVGTVGMEFRLNALFGVTLEGNLIRLNDRDAKANSYDARTFNLDLTTRF